MQTQAYQPIYIKEDFKDFTLGMINPLWSWRSVKACVRSVEKLPDQMVELTLQTNHNFNGCQPGQFVFLTVLIDGVNEQRAYSVVSCEPLAYEGVLANTFNKIVSKAITKKTAKKTTETTKKIHSKKGAYVIRLAIKIQGKVSTHIARHIKQQDLLEISQAKGDFVLPENNHRDVLFIGAGSGITPIYSMLDATLNKVHCNRHSYKKNNGQEVSKSMTAPKPKLTLVYISRDHIYANELIALAKQHENFTLHLIKDTQDKPAQFNQALLDRLSIDPSQLQTYLCGPASLMNAVNNIWKQKQIINQLKQERFVSQISDDNNAIYPVIFRQKQRQFMSQGDLLTSAESAGLNPANGCRMGICNTCVCQKVSGTVKNQLTGETSNQANETIKLCISEAMSELVIDA